MRQQQDATPSSNIRHARTPLHQPARLPTEMSMVNRTSNVEFRRLPVYQLKIQEIAERKHITPPPESHAASNSSNSHIVEGYSMQATKTDRPNRTQGEGRWRIRQETDRANIRVLRVIDVQLDIITANSSTDTTHGSLYFRCAVFHVTSDSSPVTCRMCLFAPSGFLLRPLLFSPLRLSSSRRAV